jgi:uncharacterized membrane protein
VDRVMMNVFDYSIFAFLNRFVGQHPWFDNALVYLSNKVFLTVSPVAALCWWAWFKYGQDTDVCYLGIGLIMAFAKTLK